MKINKEKDNRLYQLEAKVNNGSFEITMNSYTKNDDGTWFWAGCTHYEEYVNHHFPEYVKYLKWHGCDGVKPLHYFANSLHHAFLAKEYSDEEEYSNESLEKARKWAIWPEAELGQITRENLALRLPSVMEQYRKDIDGLFNNIEIEL